MSSRTNNSFLNFLKNNSVTISLQIVALIVLILNLWLASRLSPLVLDISSIKQDVVVVKDALAKNEEAHKDYATRIELTQLTNQLDKISGRVDQIYMILIK